MTLDDIVSQGITGVQVFVTNPETPFGGVQVFGATDIPIQIEFDSGSPVRSVFGRIGDILPVCSDYAACYAPLGVGLPAGGLLGQVLAKLSNASLDAGWVNIPPSLPVGGTTGQVLTKIDNTNYHVDWETPTEGLTGFSAGNCIPLFTTGVTPGPTPALSFTIVDTILPHYFYGNNGGSIGAPSFVQPAITDLQNLSGPSLLVGSPSTGPGVGVISLGSGLALSGNVLSATGIVPNFIDSIVSSGGNVSLVNDVISPGNSMYYGTNASGVRGFNALPSGVTGTKGAVGFSIGRTGGLSTGKVAGFAVVDYAATISAWNIVLDAGTVTIRTWKIASGSNKPTVANTINTSGVSIASGTAVRGLLLSDFSTLAVAANDIFAFEITALTGPPTELFFSLELTKL